MKELGAMRDRQVKIAAREQLAGLVPFVCQQFELVVTDFSVFSPAEDSAINLNLL